MYPKLKINTNKIKENASWVTTMASNFNISITGINKNTCQHPLVTQALIDGGVTAIGDARVHNLKHIVDLDCEKWLIRIPMIREADDVVKFCDLSVNSEISTIRALNKAAQHINKIHKVIVMVDLGDLREGYFDTEELCSCVKETLTLSNIKFMGIGVNLSCAGAIVPTVETYEKFSTMQAAIKAECGVDCAITSGGASSTFYMLKDGSIPSGINNLRVGELILYGTDVSNHLRYPELHHDTFTLEVEIIELKEKPSKPIGKIGKDAFGNEPVFEDKGIRCRALCALGQQDTDISEMTPVDNQMQIVTASSDHLIIDITDCDTQYQVGDIVSFHLNYVSGLHANTSPYIEKVIVAD